MRTEFFHLFIESKTGWLGGDFKKHAAGFAKINGMKIGAIDYRRHVVAKIDQMFAPLELFRLILLRETRCDAPNRPRRVPSLCRANKADQRSCPASTRPARQSEIGFPDSSPKR